PNNGWAMDHEIHGWNECLITYVLAAGAPRYAIDPVVYHRGYAGGRDFINGKSYYGIELPLGQPYGGPLFFTHYSFCGLDPRGLKDRYADYWDLNLRHVRINHAHCVANPYGYKGYSASCWGLTASDDPGDYPAPPLEAGTVAYSAHAPDNDNGTISPTAALASLPYAPREVLQAARHFLKKHGNKLWGRYGFVDAFCESKGWYADTYLAIDQGPIVVMMENHRSGLLWKLFMSVPEVQDGLRKLGFSSPYLDQGGKS
ncbi:MAG TPA: glucoamylase family protein, partial [Nevskia sp.]|nr:glucoamylase family protein [Nevskia sp.]